MVVNHDAGGSLQVFLASLRAEGVTEVIVVDNASSDGLRTASTLIRRSAVIRTGANLGYGSGANRGLAATGAGTEFVLVSNPDVVVHPGALAALRAAFAADPTLAIAGPRILAEDGTRYPSARRFPSALPPSVTPSSGWWPPRTGSAGATGWPTWPISIRGRRPRWTGSRGPVSWPGASALEELGGFDESYFMYLEDVDLCWRAHRAGWAVAYVPGSVVTHQQGLSTARRPYRMLLAHHRSAFHFAARRSEGWRRVTLPGVALVLLTRLGFWPGPGRRPAISQAGCAKRDPGPTKVSARSWHEEIQANG